MRKTAAFVRTTLLCAATAMVPAALVLAPATMLGQMGAPGGATPPPTPAAQSNQQTSQPMNAASQMDPSQGAAAQMQDRAFVSDVAKGDMAEVQLGQLAAQKGSSPQVKQLAQKMVDDYTKLTQQMQPIESSMQVKPPKKIDKKDQREVAKLNTLSGDAFDKEYLECVVQNHEKDLKQLKQEESSTANPQLKEVATKLEQLTQGHLAMAKQVAEAKGVPMTGKDEKSGI